MATIREYLEEKSTDELRGILRSDFEGRYEIPVDIVLLICSIIREREPPKRDPWIAYRQFLEHYWTNTENR